MVSGAASAARSLRLPSGGARAVSSAGQSACLTSRRSLVRAQHRPCPRAQYSSRSVARSARSEPVGWERFRATADRVAIPLRQRAARDRRRRRARLADGTRIGGALPCAACGCLHGSLTIDWPDRRVTTVDHDCRCVPRDHRRYGWDDLHPLCPETAAPARQRRGQRFRRSDPVHHLRVRAGAGGCRAASVSAAEPVRTGPNHDNSGKGSLNRPGFDAVPVSLTIGSSGRKEHLGGSSFEVLVGVAGAGGAVGA